MINIWYGFLLNLTLSPSRMFIYILLLLGRNFLDWAYMASINSSFKIPCALEAFLECFSYYENLTARVCNLPSNENVIYSVLTLMLLIIFFLMADSLDIYVTGLVIFCKSNLLMILIAFLIYIILFDINNVTRLCLQTSLILLIPFGIVGIKICLITRGSSFKQSRIVFVLVLL